MWDMIKTLIFRGEVSFSCPGVLSSGGRDQVVHLWDWSAGNTTKTMPVFEVSLLPGIGN